MGATRSENRHAIIMRDGTPVLMEIMADEAQGVVLVPEVDQPPRDRLMAMVEAQGGLFKPTGIFRYDPLLATSGIRGCPNCGFLYTIRGKGPGFVPVKCKRCQKPLRAMREVTEP